MGFFAALSKETLPFHLSIFFCNGLLNGECKNQKKNQTIPPTDRAKAILLRKMLERFCSCRAIIA